MKHIRIIMIAAIVLAALGFQTGNANAIFYSYTTGIAVQNLANAAAVVTLTYYNAQGTGGTGGTEATSATVDMASLASASFFPIHAAAGFKGSVVISSSQPVASIANLVGSSGTTHIGDASYVGSGVGGSPMYLPLLHQNNYGFFSWFSVQNTGGSDATVNVSYSDGTTAGPIVVKPGASYTFDQSSETHSLKFFAGTVTSTQPVVVVVNQENTIGKTIQAYTGFDKGESNTLMPLINANNYGYITGVQLQNGGTQASDVTVTYTPTVLNGSPVGHQCTETHRVAQNASVTYTLAAFAGTFKTSATDTTTCIKERFVGSAQVTGNSTDQPVIAVVNQATPTSAGAYGSFLPSRATAKVVLPLIADRNYGWYTGFNLMNVGTVPVDVSCTFTGGVAYAVNKTLQPGEAITEGQNNKIKDKYAGSGSCTAVVNGGGAGTPKITAVVNQVLRTLTITCWCMKV